jgi:hypothetical protein
MSRPLTADEAIEREKRAHEKKLALLNDPDFVESNAEALAAYDRGERGISLEEFRKKHPHPRP